MKQLCTFLVLFASACAYGQVGPTAITSTQCAYIGVGPKVSVITFQVTGTWTGTLQPQITVQGQAAANVQVTPSTSSTAASTVTANGIYTAQVNGADTFQVCGNTVASGTANVYLNTSVASKGGGSSGGGGSGTVTSVATTSPIGGGTITSTGTVTCTTCVVASSPGAGVAHFAGSTQTATSSAIVAADITSGTITGTQLSSSIALPNGATGTTQSASDNSTKVATTAYVDRVTAGAPALGKWLCGNHADGAGATWTCVSRANVASGDVLVAACSGFLADSGVAVTTVADTLSTTWTRIGSEYFESTPATYHFTAFKGTASSSGADTITCTSTNAATTFTASFLATVVGTSAVDVAPTGNSGTNGHSDSTQLTTTGANDLCFEWMTGATITLGYGGSILVYNAGNGAGMATRNVGAAGNYVLTNETGGNFGNFSFCLK